MNYRDTLNLPKTAFKMKANLTQREPEMLRRWEEEGLYRRIQEATAGRPTYILHDGPPYANGHIHLGTAFNKVLKDIILRSRRMAGYHCPYVPGWDCHGLPIEHNVDKELGPKKREIDKLAFRAACRRYAEKWIDIQREEFKRLGVLGDWQRPYRTIDLRYEAVIAREFLRFLESGAVVRSRKPVYWCTSCRTALAEAEVEYDDHESPSIYVKFPLADDVSDLVGSDSPAFVVIWTTTPWTLPANLAVALHPDFEYAAVRVGGEILILAAGRLEAFWTGLTSIGWVETAQRIGTHLLSILLVVLIVWGMRAVALGTQEDRPPLREAALAATLPTPTPTEPVLTLPAFNPETNPPAAGITRQAVLYTTIPTRPRVDVITYTVQTGDTLFGIADMFGLKPETLLWGNYAVLEDNPHVLRPGQVLNILPVDGAYYQWHAGDGLNGVAQFYGVRPEDIVNWPGNHLDPQHIGEYSNPDIPPGTWLVIPGGRRAFVSWSAPIIPRSNPASAKVLGPGFCGEILEGPVGSGAFLWPTRNHFLSGYDYTPQANHYGLDIDGETGDPVYAADSGVVVYAGWNDWGYGNLVVIDHGNGWQSLYAHLNSLNVSCGSYVTQGDVIAAIGSTGNSTGSHLHFELMHSEYGKVNPWDFLPAP